MSCEQCGSGPGCPDDVKCSACAPCGDPDAVLGFKTKRYATRGDTIEIDYELVDKNGAALDLSISGTKAWFTVKDYLIRADSQASWQGTIGTGIVQTSPGRMTVTIPASVTALWPDGVQRLYYDLAVKEPAGRVTTIEKGLIILDPDVTLTRT